MAELPDRLFRDSKLYNKGFSTEEGTFAQDEDYYDYKDADTIAFDAMQDNTANPEVENMMEEGQANNTAMLHTALAAAGMAPGVGIIADMADAALYAMEGDVAGAGLSLISAVPILGLVSGAGRAGKAASKYMGVAGKFEAPGLMGDVAKRMDSPAARQNVEKGIEGMMGARGGMNATSAMRNVGTAAVKQEGRISDRYAGFKKLEEQFQKADSPVGENVYNEAGKKINNAMSGMRNEMQNVMRVSDATKLDEDSAAALIAFIKGKDAVLGAERSGAFGGKALIDMRDAIARGSRIFYSLDNMGQQEVLNMALESDNEVQNKIGNEVGANQRMGYQD